MKPGWRWFGRGLTPILAVVFATVVQASPVSLQERIDAIAASDGGTLTLTAGVYRTGALFFKPRVNLHLEKGATILGVDEGDAYPMRETRIEGETCIYYPALINADGCDGFTVSGEGVIDGHGLPTWREFWRRRAEARRKGGEFPNKSLMRPRLLYVSNSKNVDVSGVTFRNSKFWTTHYYRCEDVRVHDCTIEAEVMEGVRGPSTDAIDIDVCRRFCVSNVVMNVNDDAVVVKGGKGPWADDYARFPGNGPSEDVLVVDCTFKSVCHSCLTIGSECPAATNIVLRGAKLEGPGNLLNLKMRSDTPQHYAKILVEGCEGECKTFLSVMRWSQYHDAKGRPEQELKSYADGVTMRGNKVVVERMKCIAPSKGAYELKGLVFENNEIKEQNFLSRSK